MSQLAGKSLNEHLQTVPAAVRSRHPGWRDPRLILGVALVAGCILLGAKVLAAADNTVPVWSVRRDLPAGATLTAAALKTSRVRLSEDAAANYFVGDQRPDAGSLLAHDVAAGELLPRSAVQSSGARKLIEVPLSVASDDLPGTVRQGSVVDVWATPKVGAVDSSANTGKTRARLLLDDVVVVALPRSGDSLAPESTRQVIVGLDETQDDELAAALGGIADSRVIVIRQTVGR